MKGPALSEHIARQHWQYVFRLLSLKLSSAQAFSVVCSTKFGCKIPLECKGQQQARTAPFRTAAVQSLSTEETDEGLQHAECLEYLFTGEYVKQYKY